MKEITAGLKKGLKIFLKNRLFNRLGGAAFLSACFMFVIVAELQAASAQLRTVSMRFQVCHGYGCYFRTNVALTPADLRVIGRVFAEKGRTPQGEREAIKKAVAVFEERSTQVIGVRDEPRMAFGRPGRKGQMDCVDESVNTEGLLVYLQKAGHLKFHKPARRTVRGMFIDGRYPHWTAVIVDHNNVKWAVDSWYEAGGGEPDIIPLKEWKKRGVSGKR